jgi:hypothetical protein
LPFGYADTHRRFWFNKKTRDCLAIAGFVKNSCASIELPRVANPLGTALPEGHLAAAQRDARLDVQRGFHFELRTVNSIVGGLSKNFLLRFHSAQPGRAGVAKTPNWSAAL